MTYKVFQKNLLRLAAAIGEVAGEDLRVRETRDGHGAEFSIRGEGLAGVHVRAHRGESGELDILVRQLEETVLGPILGHDMEAMLTAIRSLLPQPPSGMPGQERLALGSQKRGLNF